MPSSPRDTYGTATATSAVPRPHRPGAPVPSRGATRSTRILEPDEAHLGAPMPVPSFGGSSTTARRPTSAASRARARDDYDDELDEASGAARHVAGFLFGLLVTPVGMALLGIGLARVDGLAGTHGIGADKTGLAMLAGGICLLACVALLGAWTPAVPITGGVVWGLGLGAAYMLIPSTMKDLVASLVDDAPTFVDQLTHTAMNGDLVVVGALLFMAGVTASVARRRGRRWAEEMSDERAQAGRSAAPSSPAHSRM